MTTAPDNRDTTAPYISRRLRHQWRVGLLILLALFLAAEAVNVPLAIWFARHDMRVNPSLPQRIRSGIAEGTRWPTATPHHQPWPTPTHWDKGQVRFGWWRDDVRFVDANNNSRFHAQVDLFGWPLPCFEMVQFWSPQNDPTWTLPTSQSGFIRLRWSGILLNPFLFTLAIWAILVLPILLVRWTRWRTRLSLGHCPDCAYDLQHNFPAGCPECGWNRTPRASSSMPTSP